MRIPSGARLTVADWLSEAVPDWLAGLMRPKKAPVPWPDMMRAVLAIWLPFAAGVITGRLDIAVLPAMGGLLSVMIDQGGPYRARVRRIGTAAVFGGAAGLAVGSVIHGRGWVAVVAIVIVAGVSSILARLGATGSITGLQLLVYSVLSLGPLGELRPWWHSAVGFVAGVVWALVLITPSFLLSPRAPEQRAVAAVYHALASDLRAIGTQGGAAARQAVAAALNAAYDALLTGRSSASGRNKRDMRLMVILNVSHQMTEAVTALTASGERPPPWVIDTVGRLADAVLALPAYRGDTSGLPLPSIPPQWSASPGALALRDSMVALTRAISGNWAPSPAPRHADRGPRQPLRDRLRGRATRLADQLIGGQIAWTFTTRLMICTGIAAAMSEVVPLDRSYWVMLTVAIVLKPDYGSVFARAVQRGFGTVAGALVGAAVVALVPYGPWLLLPFGVLAALLPYGKSRNFGLTATFLTPLVVLLIDLLKSGGWELAGARAIDTLLGCAIVLLIGYAPWPVAWHAHLPGQFAGTLGKVAAFMDESLVAAWAPGTGQTTPGTAAATVLAPRSRLRRQTWRALSDLRAEYQRTMAEPAAVSRRAAAWWPAVVGLEEVMDAVTSTAVAISRGAAAPTPAAVHTLTARLRGVAGAINARIAPPADSDLLPDDPRLEPVTAAVRSVLSVLTRAGGGAPAPGESRSPAPA